MKKTSSYAFIIFFCGLMTLVVILNWNDNRMDNKKFEKKKETKDSIKQENFSPIGYFPKTEKVNKKKEEPKTFQEQLEMLFPELDSFYLKRNIGSVDVQTDSGKRMIEWALYQEDLADSVYEEIVLMKDTLYKDSIIKYDVTHTKSDERGDSLRKTITRFSLKNNLNKKRIGYIDNGTDVWQLSDSLDFFPLETNKKTDTLNTQKVIDLLKKIKETNKKT